MPLRDGVVSYNSNPCKVDESKAVDQCTGASGQNKGVTCLVSFGSNLPDELLLFINSKIISMDHQVVRVSIYSCVTCVLAVSNIRGVLRMKKKLKGYL